MTKSLSLKLKVEPSEFLEHIEEILEYSGTRYLIHLLLGKFVWAFEKWIDEFSALRCFENGSVFLRQFIVDQKCKNVDQFPFSAREEVIAYLFKAKIHEIVNELLNLIFKLRILTQDSLIGVFEHSKLSLCYSFENAY